MYLPNAEGVRVGKLGASGFMSAGVAMAGSGVEVIEI
jgi:hypothetical protein